MTKNLYEILGVSQTATKKEIRSAHRKLASTHHPDKGGDPELFKEIQFAYSVLSDDKRRAHYDQTGEVDEFNDDLSDIVSILSPLLTKTLSEACSFGGKPTQRDLISMMRASIKTRITNLELGKTTVKETKEIYQEVKGRFSTTEDQQDVLNDIVEYHIRSADMELERIKAEERVLNLTLNYLDKCKFRSDSKGFGPSTSSGPKFVIGGKIQ